MNIYWASAVASKHSQNIYHNHGRVAISIFNSNVSEGTGEGLYFYGTACELNPDLTQQAMNRLIKRSGKQLNRTPQDYLDHSPRRIYHFQPQQAWITGERLAFGNQLVDTKIEISIPKLLAYSLV